MLGLPSKLHSLLAYVILIHGESFTSRGEAREEGRPDQKTGEGSMGGVQKALGRRRPAVFMRVVLYSMNVVSKAFSGHLGDCDLAAFSIASVLHARRLHAAFVAHPLSLRRAPCSDIHLQRAAAQRAGLAGRAGPRGWHGQRVPAPAAFHVCHPPSAQRVPSVPAQELGHRADKGKLIICLTLCVSLLI